MRKWFAAPLLVVLGSGVGPDQGRASWVGTCACDSDGPEYSCHGQWTVWADSEAQLGQQCSDQTNRSGSLLDVKEVSDGGAEPADLVEAPAGPLDPSRD